MEPPGNREPPGATGGGTRGRDEPPRASATADAADRGPIIRHRDGRLAGGSATVAGGVLALLVLWAPLPFASVEPGAAALLRLGAALALVLAAPVARSHRLRPVAVPALALAGLGLLGFVQLLPLPPWLVRLLSPGHAEAWGRAAELLEAQAAAGLLAGNPVGWPRLTLDPAATAGAALTALALAALLVAAALVGRQRRRRRWLGAAFVAAGLFQVIYGLRQLLAGSREVWGVPVLGVTDRLRGTFVNPNHAAYLLEICLAVAFAAGWWALVHARREGSLETRLLLVLPPAVIWIALLSGLALTRSRAGLLAALVGVAVQSALLALPVRRRGGRRGTVAVAAVAVLVGLGIVVGMVSGDAFSRLLGTSLSEVTLGARTRVAALTVRLWLHHPLTGSGLGTFRDAFTGVDPGGLEGGAWLHAHNDYLELLATGGLVGAGLVAVGSVFLVRRLLRVLGRGRRSEDRAAALAALGALAAVAVHEAFDFGLLLPANPVLLAVLCGAAVGARTHAPGPSLSRSGGRGGSRRR